jgi:hypothetical protein
MKPCPFASRTNANAELAIEQRDLLTRRTAGPRLGALLSAEPALRARVLAVRTADATAWTLEPGGTLHHVLLLGTYWRVPIHYTFGGN